MLEYYFNIDDDIFRLPVNPPKLKIKMGASIEQIDMTTLGKVTLFTGKDVDSISFTTFWPTSDQPYCNHTGIRHPSEFKDKIIKAKNKGIPVRFIGTEIGLNKLFYISSFEPEYEEGPGATRMNFDISLIESVTPIIPVHEKNTNSKGQNGKTSVKKTYKRITYKPSNKTDKTYKVKHGDSLWSIAKRYYGNGSKYKKIIAANKNKFKKNNMIYKGMELVIPHE